MQTLYNSDSYVVVSFDLGAGTQDGAADGHRPAPRGGFEVIDKLARKEIFIQGPLAKQFQQGVQALVKYNAVTGVYEAVQYWDRMELGKGYWLASDVDGTIVPAQW